MSDFFRAFQAVGTTVPMYFIESTAPNNVDDVMPSNASSVPPELRLIASADAAVEEIAAALANAEHPNLVVMVHGFNNPRPAVLQAYSVAARAIEADDAIKQRHGIVCVGYRWPSEKMGQPRAGSWSALATLPRWIYRFGLAIILIPLIAYYLLSAPRPWPFTALPLGWNLSIAHFIALAGWTIAGLILTAMLLRLIVYFRDQYRSTQYGVPDLVQIIRAIDSALVRIRNTRREQERHDVQLSFLGHSMGGYVVTSTIRILSDVFDMEVQSLGSFGRGGYDEHARDTPHHIGNVFCLKRFVLASPDIPAETLLSSRGNFLASALTRFDEAYLFSNEGDEVLRQISTLANYFVFPTRSRDHGFRLGNVEILSRGYGLIDVPDADFLKSLRVGNLTLEQLNGNLRSAGEQRSRAAGEPAGRGLSAAPPPLPKHFTYFDCTDYIDGPTEETWRPLLTFGKRQKRYDAAAKLRWYSHFALLLSYLFRGQRPNVHGGYFEGEIGRALMFRLVCLGYRDTLAAFGNVNALSAACDRHQIRGLISPLLR